MKKLLSLCLCVVLLLGCLVGCGASGSRDKAPKSDTSSEGSEVADTSSVTDIEIDSNTASSEQSSDGAVDYGRFCGTYGDGDIENGPYYSFELSSFDASTSEAVCSVNYLGRNVSPIYSTDDITVTVGTDGKAQFLWEDNWENKGIGEFALCDDGGLCVKLKMTVTEPAEANRATLATDGVRIMYKSEK